jgi:hypothetical protein
MKIKEFSFLYNSRIIAISDVHGGYNELVSLLDACKINLQDTIIFLGNIIEKGSNSLKTLRYIMQLAKDYNVKCVRGNLEYPFLSDDSEHKNNLLFNLQKNRQEGKDSIFFEVEKELSMSITSIEDIDTVFNYLTDEIAFIRSWDDVYITDKVIFSHAGFTNENIDENEYFNFLNNRSFFKDAPVGLKYQVFGHVPTGYLREDLNFFPLFDKSRKILAINGGLNVSKCGMLNAVIIQKNDKNLLTFTFRYSTNKPLVVVYPNSDIENNSIITLKNKDLTIEMIEAGTATSKVESVEKRIQIVIPNEFIYNKHGRSFLLTDYTSYHHQVTKQTLGYLIFEDNHYQYLNINGKIGWYKK